MNSWSSRIKERMEALNMTSDMVARKMGITRGAVAHYLVGRRVPPLKQFKKLAAILKADPAWLQFGTDIITEPVKEIIVNKEPTQYPLPILSWDQLTDFADIDKLKNKAADFVPHLFTDQPRWYALRVRGDSMTAPTGHGHSFKESDILIIDPDKTPIHGSFVIALLPRAREATFKQYVKDGGFTYLKPLNPQYPTIEIEESTHMCGIIIKAITGIC